MNHADKYAENLRESIKRRVDSTDISELMQVSTLLIQLIRFLSVKQAIEERHES